MSALVAATLMLERLAYLAVLPIGVGLACIFGVQVVYADLPEKKHSEIKDLVPEKVKVPVPGKADGPEPAAKLASHLIRVTAASLSWQILCNLICGT